ncbi:hypothetical protein J6590_021342 [Homalodisca vitripennis]|nr:hypothetical protein J6590_021342 [Homalodisca vitripennis]
MSEGIADNMWCYFSVTYPLDLTKTRLQIQGELAAGTNGVSHVSHQIALIWLLTIVRY